MTGDRQRDERDDAPERLYANYVTIGHNAFEFLLEFGQLYNGNGGVRVQARIVLSPPSARDLMDVLREAVDEYEREFGCQRNG